MEKDFQKVEQVKSHQPQQVSKNLFKKVPSWGVVGLLLIITAGAAFLRFYHIDRLSFWSDEIFTMLFVNHSVKEMFFEVLWPKELNMSIFYLIINFWAHIFLNPSEGVLRSISAIFSIASIPAVFFLGKTITEDKKAANCIGLVAAFLVSLNAYHIQYAQELRSYSLTFLLCVLSTILLIKAFKNHNAWKFWAGYTFVNIIGVYSHNFFVLLIFAQALSLVVLFNNNKKVFPLKKAIISYVLTALSVIPLAIAAFQAGTGNLAWINKPTINYILQFAIAITGGQGMPLFVFYFVAVSFGLLAGRAWQQNETFKKWIPVLFASCLFLPVAIILFVSAVYKPFFVYRYFLFLMPFFSIFAAVGIVKLIYTKNLIPMLMGILLFSLITIFSILGVKNYFTKFQKENWRDVSKFLSENCVASDSLRLYYATWTRGFTSYYNNQLKTQNDEVQKNIENTTSENIESLIPENYQKVCLVLSQNYAPKDVANTRLIQTAIQKKYPNITETKFSGVRVEIYEKQKNLLKL